MPASWFDLLKVEMDTLSPEELLKPDTEVEMNDHIVGDAATDTELQQLYAVGIKLMEAAERAVLDAKWTKGDKAKQEELLAKANELHEKGKLVIDLFWVSIKDSFRLWDKSAVGVREGWQVVWSDQDTSLPPFLRQLFGDDS